MAAKGCAVLSIHADSFHAALACTSINVGFNMKLVYLIIRHPHRPPSPSNFQVKFPIQGFFIFGVQAYSMVLHQ